MKKWRDKWRDFWPKRQKRTTAEAAEEALRVFPRCC